MTDTELAAFTAIVNQETVLMSADNMQRERNGYAPAWTGNISDAAQALYDELKVRGLLK